MLSSTVTLPIRPLAAPQIPIDDPPAYDQTELSPTDDHAPRKSVYSLVKIAPEFDQAEHDDYSLVKGRRRPGDSGDLTPSGSSQPNGASSSSVEEPLDGPPPDYGLPPRYNQIPMLDSLAKSQKNKRTRDLKRRAEIDGTVMNEGNKLYRHACIDVAFGRAQFLRIPLSFPPIRLSKDDTVVLWSPETSSHIVWKDGVGALEEKYCARKGEKSTFTAEEILDRIGGEEYMELPYGGCTAEQGTGHFYDPEIEPPLVYGKKADNMSMDAAYWAIARQRPRLTHPDSLDRAHGL